MKFSMRIDSGNVDTTLPTREMALARYLRQVADRVENYSVAGSIIDGNGARIGDFHLETDSPEEDDSTSENSG